MEHKRTACLQDLVILQRKVNYQGPAEWIQVSNIVGAQPVEILPASDQVRFRKVLESRPRKTENEKALWRTRHQLAVALKSNRAQNAIVPEPGLDADTAPAPESLQYEHAVLCERLEQLRVTLSEKKISDEGFVRAEDLLFPFELFEFNGQVYNLLCCPVSSTVIAVTGNPTSFQSGSPNKPTYTIGDKLDVADATGEIRQMTVIEATANELTLVRSAVLEGAEDEDPLKSATKVATNVPEIVEVVDSSEFRRRVGDIVRWQNREWCIQELFARSADSPYLARLEEYIHPLTESCPQQPGQSVAPYMDLRDADTVSRILQPYNVGEGISVVDSKGDIVPATVTDVRENGVRIKYLFGKEDIPSEWLRLQSNRIHLRRQLQSYELGGKVLINIDCLPEEQQRLLLTFRRGSENEVFLSITEVHNDRIQFRGQGDAPQWIPRDSPAILSVAGPPTRNS